MAKPIAKKSKWVPEEVKSAYEEFRLDPGVLSGLGLAFSPLEATGNAAGDFVFDNTSGLPVPLRAGLSTAGYMLGSGALGTGPFTGSAKLLGRGAKSLKPQLADLAEKYTMPMRSYAVPPEKGRAAFLKQWGGNRPDQRASIKELQEKVKQQRGTYGAQRVERAADEVPNLEQQYTQRAIEKAFLGQGGDNATGVMVLKPKDFEEYAKPIAPNALERLEYKRNPITGDWVTAEQYTSDLAKHIQDMGASEVPYLQLQRADDGSLRIAGHEGRHRMRALDELGDKSTLVEMIPVRGVRESIPRSSQEEYINELAAQLGLDPTVSPEIFPDVKLPMPEVFAKGGKVGHPNKYVEKVQNWGRRGQMYAADKLGIGDEVKFASTIPERYYPASEQHNGPGDAMRHILLQAQLRQKYGELPAKAVGWGHELVGTIMGETPSEKTMDDFNDALGRKIGSTAKDKADMTWQAMQAIKSGEAHTIQHPEEDNYAEGGLVHSEFNFDEINHYAEGGIVAHNDFNYGEISKMADQLVGSMYG